MYFPKCSFTDGRYSLDFRTKSIYFCVHSLRYVTRLEYQLLLKWFDLRQISITVHNMSKNKAVKIFVYLNMKIA